MKQTICKFPGCITLLNKLSDKNFCRVHLRILEQNDIVYSRGRYTKVDYDAVIRKKPVPVEKVKECRELLPVAEWLGKGRL